MAEITKEVMEMVNKPDRIGVLGTVDAEGQPNIAYLGSPRLREDGKLTLALSGGRSMQNLKFNTKAVFLCLQESPVTFETPGVRLYLELDELQRAGSVFEEYKKVIAQKVSPEAADRLQAAAVFSVTEVRDLVDR